MANQEISLQRLNEVRAIAMTAFRRAQNELHGSIDPTAYSIVAVVDAIISELGIEIETTPEQAGEIAEEEQDRQDEIQEDTTDMEEKADELNTPTV